MATRNLAGAWGRARSAVRPLHAHVHPVAHQAVAPTNSPASPCGPGLAEGAGRRAPADARNDDDAGGGDDDGSGERRRARVGGGTGAERSVVAQPRAAASEALPPRAPSPAPEAAAPRIADLHWPGDIPISTGRMQSPPRWRSASSSASLASAEASRAWLSRAPWTRAAPWAGSTDCRTWASACSRWWSAPASDPFDRGRREAQDVVERPGPDASRRGARHGRRELGILSATPRRDRAVPSSP